MISNVKHHVVSLARGRTVARLVIVIRVPEFIKGSRLSLGTLWVCGRAYGKTSA